MEYGHLPPLFELHVQRETAHAFLRRETEHLHAAVEAAFAAFDLTARAGLGRFLTAQVMAVGVAEDELDRGGIDRLVDDWPSRRRKRAALADLAWLAIPAPAAEMANSRLHLDTAGRQLGALYVLEGSRLGGRILARQLEDSTDELVRRATRFLRPPPRPGGWASFLALLENLSPARNELLGGAADTFRLFEAAATHARLEQFSS